MSSLAKTKRRINSIKGTEKITKAMELVATVKTKRFSVMHEKGFEYSQEFLSLFSQVFAFDKSKEVSHYAKLNEGNLPILYLVISSNMGLCGAYNNNVFKFAETNMNSNDIVAPIGSKAFNRYSRDAKFEGRVIDDFVGISTDSKMEEIHALTS